ncbi:MAG TPA: hypothetical protein VJ995_03245 [Geothermobacteraceae bacterium]|nr:hypothetical protein [Geothermobacteraceae bacterium]
MEHCIGEAHKMHMCNLKAEGKFELIASLSDQPQVECKHCGAKANSLKYVCAAHLGDQAPNVEGGHGIVDLTKVGKPHAG